MPSERPIDLLNNPAREYVFRSKNRHSFKKLAKKTHFTFREVEALALIHNKITSTLGRMNRSIFRDFMHHALDFTENKRHLLIDRIFNEIDKKGKLMLPYKQWIKGLSIILKGDFDERIHFVWQVYDTSRINKIKRDQMFPMMRGCLINMHPDEDLDESVKDLIDIMLRKLDKDRDGFLDEEEFRITISEIEPLLLECFGPVLPTREAQHTFLKTFTNKFHPL